MRVHCKLEISVPAYGGKQIFLPAPEGPCYNFYKTRNYLRASHLRTLMKLLASHRSLPLISSAFLFLFSFSGCTQKVVLTPGADDLVVLNGCVISACNYLAVLKTQHGLEPNFWAKILLVRYENHPAGHAYCVWETEGTIYGYDRNAGSFPIPVYTRDARTIAIVLAQGLSKVMAEHLAVSKAEFVEPQADVYRY